MGAACKCAHGMHGPSFCMPVRGPCSPLVTWTAPAQTHARSHALLITAPLSRCCSQSSAGLTCLPYRDPGSPLIASAAPDHDMHSLHYPAPAMLTCLPLRGPDRSMTTSTSCLSFTTNAPTPTCGSKHARLCPCALATALAALHAWKVMCGGMLHLPGLLLLVFPIRPGCTTQAAETQAGHQPLNPSPRALPFVSSNPGCTT